MCRVRFGFSLDNQVDMSVEPLELCNKAKGVSSKTVVHVFTISDKMVVNLHVWMGVVLVTVLTVNT